MKIEEKSKRKELNEKIFGCRTKANIIISELRNLKNLAYVPNDLLAKLNDMAYKGVSEGSLNKLLDKRAIQNEELYKRLD